jgi:tetratricopeptide (TPR) repeat protein
MGEYLARRYPNSSGARQGASLAMVAYVKLFNKAPPDDRQFESDRMVDIADYITKRWEGQPEADEAWMMLIRNALGSGDLDKAQEYLDKISPDSPRRGEVELMTGQKLWSTYLEASRRQQQQRPPQADLDKMVLKARQILEAGIARMRKSVDDSAQQGDADVSYTLVASVLSLAQIGIGAGDPGKAVTWLEDPKIGPLTLVRADHPATDRGNFRIETCKAALRAYVATQQVNDAEDVMKALEELVKKGGDAEAGSKLTQIYVSLGRELQQQLERLRNEEKPDEVEKVKQGFERFLDRVSKRDEGNTFNSLNWVAETFVGLAAYLDPGGKTLPPEAAEYYQKAAHTYQRILTDCQEEKIQCPPGATTSIKIRLARCLRRLGQFKEALKLLLDVLKARTNMVDAQVEAAYTYQARGEIKPGYYEFAIKGSRNYKQIWGWGKIAGMVVRSNKHRSVFHEARYNLALCRFNWALTKPKKEKAKMLAQAEKDILVTQKLYPVRSSEQWYKEYDELLKKIQKLRSKKAVGLKAVAAKQKISRR